MDNTASGNHLTCNPTLLDSAPTVNRKRRGACLYQIRVSETRFNLHLIRTRQCNQSAPSQSNTLSRPSKVDPTLACGIFQQHAAPTG